MKFNKIDIFIYLLIVFIIIIEIIKPKSYESNYKIADFNIKEMYNNGTKQYSLSMDNGKSKFFYQTSSDYFLKHNIINNIDYLSDDISICIIPNSQAIEIPPLCSVKNEYVDYHLVYSEIKNSLNQKTKEEKVINTVDNIDVYNNEKNYLIWNYNDFISITPNKIKKINLFNKDIYNPYLTAIVNNYLLIANYEQDYNYNQFKIINLKTFKEETWNIKYEISDNSHILGVNNKSVYIVDKKNKIEYELVPSYKKIRIIGTASKNGKILTDKWESISLTKLTQENLSFSNKHLYELKNNQLFMKIDNTYIRVSNKKIKDIIYQNNNSVYYISDDSIYSYEPLEGETKLLQCFEWNFNYKNLIYIY